MEGAQIVRSREAKLGLLSQTVIPSPHVQWVLSARLRHKLRNDVVFVGERCLQIKEAVSGLHLEDVMVKSDFDAKIMAAKVINVNTELSWEEQMRLRASNSIPAASVELHDNLPPQILVIVLASRELVFVYCSESKENKFVHFRRPLPSDVSSFERFGRHVAVDPRSRAIAVAASTDYFGVFMLKQPQVLKSQMAQKQLDPILEERFFRVDGDILFMDFLYPKAEDGDKMILLLLVAKDEDTHAVCYDWDSCETLRHSSPRVVRTQLPPEDSLPTMLAPLKKATSFMLVTPTSIAVYKNILDPRQQSNRYPLAVPDQKSRRSPLWTRWARPCRNWAYNQKHDDVYLCREDGQLFYLEIGNEGEIEHQTNLGQLCCDVDAAFDILDIGFEGGDLLLAVGNTGDGGLFLQKARDHPRCVQRFPNWAPVTDSVLIESGQSSVRTNPPRTFVCSASTVGQGAILELRHGVEAQIGLVLSLEDFSSTRDMWSMADAVNGGVYVLISDPMSSLLLYVPTDEGEEISAIDEELSGLNGSRQTLAAGCAPSGILVQVTDRSINLGATHGSFTRFCFEYDPDQSVITAAVHSSASMLITAVRRNHEIRLHLTRVVLSGTELRAAGVGEPLSIKSEPVCLAIEEFGFASFVFIGTGDGKLIVYGIEEDGLHYLSDFAVQMKQSEDTSRAIESLARVSTDTDEFLLCGLRCGALVGFCITFDLHNAASPIALVQSFSQHMGDSPVRLVGRGTFALLTCDEGFWRLSCSTDHGLSSYDLQRIWITDQNNPAYDQKSVDVFALIDVLPDPDLASLSGSLFCITEGQLVICTLGHKARTVPRRIGLPGSASKLIYSEHLKSLVVVYTSSELEASVDSIRRYTRPIIDFVDPDTQGQIFQGWRPRGAAGEKITCMLEWTPRQGNEEYHFLVIGTSRKQQGDLPRGRVIFLQASRNAADPSRIECSVKHIHKFESSVYCIAPYGASNLMVATGHEIVPLDSKFAEINWERNARYRLMSPALSITVHEPYLYVSTARESLVVLKVQENRLVLHAQDRVQRDGLSHVHLGGEMKLTMASSRGGTVSLLTDQDISSGHLMPVAVSEAHLPLSVIRLHSARWDRLEENHRVYGTTMDGTVYCFSTLPEEVWRLFRFLQNLAVRDPVICPFTSKRRRKCNPADVEPSANKPSKMHIDGDILGRLVNYGSHHLRRLLAGDKVLDSVNREGAPGNRITERFSQLAEEAFGASDDPVEVVMRRLRHYLR